MKKVRVLSSQICSCRVIDVPPVSFTETEQIIRHKMAAFYPGSPDDLYIDHIVEKGKAIVFFALKSRIDQIRSDEGDVSFYSQWHIFDAVEDKSGYFAITGVDQRNLFLYRGNRLVETGIVDVLPEEEEVTLLSPKDPISKKSEPIFSIRKRKNYGLFNLLLLVLLLIIPQLGLYRQTMMDERYLSELTREINRMTMETARASTSEDELKVLKNQYDQLLRKRPLMLYHFLLDLSTALDKDTHIDSLVLKNNSFQLNGEGKNILGKMENFQKNDSFRHVLPYQVKALDDTTRETFSLTGVYYDE